MMFNTIYKRYDKKLQKIYNTFAYLCFATKKLPFKLEIYKNFLYVILIIDREIIRRDWR